MSDGDEMERRVKTIEETIRENAHELLTLRSYAERTKHNLKEACACLDVVIDRVNRLELKLKEKLNVE